MSHVKFGSWAVPETPVVIEYSLVVIEEIRHDVTEGYQRLSRGGIEVGGILYGTHDGLSVRILAIRPIACEHAHGPAFQLSKNDRMDLDEQLMGDQQDSHLAGMVAVGWYLSHTRTEILLSESDLDIYSKFFPAPWQVTLVIHPGRGGSMRAGFFVREEDGTVKGERSYLEFNFPDRLAGVLDRRVDRPPRERRLGGMRRPSSFQRAESVVVEPVSRRESVREQYAREREQTARAQPVQEQAAQTVQEPTVQEQTIPEPIVHEHSVQEPTIQEQQVQEHSVQEPAIQEHTVPEPIVQEHSVQEYQVQEYQVQERPVQEPSGQEYSVQEYPVQESSVQEPSVQEYTGTTQPSLVLPPLPRRATPRIKRPLLVLSAVLVLVAAALIFRSSMPQPAPEPISLSVIERDGQLQMEWNHSAKPVTTAVRGSLQIVDGTETRTLNLTPQDLASGKFTYARKTGDVEIRMTVENANGRRVQEASRFLGQPPAKPRSDDITALEQRRAELEAQVANLRQGNNAQAARIQQLERTLRILQTRLGIDRGK